MSETKNFNLLSINLRSHTFETIDVEYKAYLLGIIASNEKNIQEGQVCMVLQGDMIPEDANVNHTLPYQKLANDVKRHLKITADDPTLHFPDFDSEELTWHFLRGLFDALGSISLKNGKPKCVMPLHPLWMNISTLSGIPCSFNETCISWTEVDTIDFLWKLYQHSTVKLKSKYDAYQSILATWFKESTSSFKYVLTCPEAIKPQKNRGSDSGYDLHLIKKLKEEKGVSYYDTGVQIQPDAGYYMDLVGRSSISKSGYMLANNIGIIDHGYRGHIIVALVKTNPEDPPLELPCKLVQLIPKKIIHMESVQVDSLEETSRQDSGGLGSKHFA